MAMVYDYLRDHFGIGADEVDVRQHFPKDFVARFQHDAHRDRVLEARPRGALLPLVWTPWRRTSQGHAGTFRFKGGGPFPGATACPEPRLGTNGPGVLVRQGGALAIQGCAARG